MNDNAHPFWKWAWKALVGIMLLPFVLLPLAILIEFIVTKVLATGPYL